MSKVVDVAGVSHALKSIEQHIAGPTNSAALHLRTSSVHSSRSCSSLLICCLLSCKARTAAMNLSGSSQFPARSSHLDRGHDQKRQRADCLKSMVMHSTWAFHRELHGCCWSRGIGRTYSECRNCPQRESNGKPSNVCSLGPMKRSLLEAGAKQLVRIGSFSDRQAATRDQHARHDGAALVDRRSRHRGLGRRVATRRRREAVLCEELGQPCILRQRTTIRPSEDPTNAA